MGERLKAPPLMEAVCEFRFDPKSDWDWTIPGQLYDRIKGEFRKRVRTHAWGVELKSGEEPPAIMAAPERVRLKRDDESAMVQSGPHLLAINHFPPYPGWQEFLALIVHVYDEYRQVAGPADLARIGLRYINAMQQPGSDLTPGDFISVKPPLSGPLDRPLKAFFQKYEIEHDSPQGLLTLQTGTAEIKEQPVYLLDLDFGSEGVKNLRELEQVREWLNSAHDRVHEAFVASLNKQLYERLKEGKE